MRTPATGTRQRIIDEGTRLFAEQGYAGTSVRQIVEAAGVTKPTLYYWFGNKEGLFGALVDVHMGHWFEVLEAIVNGEGSALERLDAYLRASLREARDKPEVLSFLAQAFHQAGQGATGVDCTRFVATEARLLTQLAADGIEAGELRAGLRPDDVALAAIGLVHIRIGACLHGGVPLSEEAAAAAADILLNGVSP
ncbi:MAG TPA: TetR/AcrR family transcriptional regulator [Myxococcota bacterium]|nr:TetR/AcrR family transcriptional regulator [Myxococcota bacterium]